MWIFFKLIAQGKQIEEAGNAVPKKARSRLLAYIARTPSNLDSDTMVVGSTDVAKYIIMVIIQDNVDRLKSLIVVFMD